MTLTPRTITEMQNRPTCYEIAINGTPVAFVSRRTKAMLLDVAVDNIDMLRELAEDHNAKDKYTKADGWLIGGNVRVCYTGYTERDRAYEANRL